MSQLWSQSTPVNLNWAIFLRIELTHFWSDFASQLTQLSTDSFIHEQMGHPVLFNNPGARPWRGWASVPWLGTARSWCRWPSSSRTATSARCTTRRRTTTSSGRCSSRGGCTRATTTVRMFKMWTLVCAIPHHAYGWEFTQPRTHLFDHH